MPNAGGSTLVKGVSTGRGRNGGTRTEGQPVDDGVPPTEDVSRKVCELLDGLEDGVVVALHDVARGHSHEERPEGPVCIHHVLNIAHIPNASQGDVPVDDLLELVRAHVRGERFGEPARATLDVCVVCGEAARAELLPEHLASVVEGRTWVHERKGGHQARAMHIIAGRITELSI